MRPIQITADTPSTIVLGGVEYRVDDKAALDAVDRATPDEVREARRRLWAILDADRERNGEKIQ